LIVGKKRILLTLATGTGKTSIAFQLSWKLFQSRWNLSEKQRRPRILFLADRNILANQAFNAFSAFPEDALIRISPDEISKKGHPPKNGSVFFSIFQTLMTGTTPVYQEYTPDFFDFIVIDECHRGGAKDESNWRQILEYFAIAVQLGLTATPKRKDNVDTYAYFGEPVYSYALKTGIDDGFLTPFKMEQIATTLDDYVYTAEDTILEGEIETGKIYSEDDFNRVIEIKQREAYRVQLFMDKVDLTQKTLVFCATQAHALAVRDLINQNKICTDTDYCVRVTANDGAEGEKFLRQFQDNEKTIPTILTTSQKLSTGVDALNIRNIVLMRPINSMIEFKQIIGRGTRLFDGKDYFTVYDFVKAYTHFNDPEWDGDPLEPKEVTKTITALKPCSNCNQRLCVCICECCSELPCICVKKVKVQLAENNALQIQHISSIVFFDADCKPLSAIEFIQQFFDELPDLFKTPEELRALWCNPDTRQKLLEGLNDKGYSSEKLHDISRLINAENSDLFDVLAHISFTLPVVSRQQRVDTHKQMIFDSCNDKQQQFLDFVLNHYVDTGVSELALDKLPALLKLKYHSIPDAKQVLGDIPNIRDLFVHFQTELYAN